MHEAPDHAFPAPLRLLLRYFRAQRPLRGGSLLVTIFGDAIAPRGGAVTLGSLIELAAPFGLTERLVRTSVARLAREGWLAAERSGRRSEYRLSRQGAERFAEATQRIYGRMVTDWDGRWTLLFLPPGGRRPAKLRNALRWLGFGELASGVFAHPGATPADARAWLQNVPGAGGALLLRSHTDAHSEKQLAAAGWDLAALGRRYRRFLRRFEPLEAVMVGLGSESAFMVRTLLIHEYRKIHLLDPLLPVTLLPPGWVGTRAYELSRRVYSQVLPPSEAYLSRVARRLHGVLPAADRALYARFGAASPTDRPGVSAHDRDTMTTGGS